jgi:uncharacterized protein (UPF0248 family)
MVYRVLGKLLWKGGLRRSEITILHRGAPGDRKVIPGSSVKEVKKGYLIITGPGEEETVIPLHRVMEVRTDGKQIWKRAGKP